MKYFTIDSSVIISSLLSFERRHEEALKIWESVLEGHILAILHFTILIEVVSAIRRRTGSEILAKEIRREILNLNNVIFVDIDKQFAEAAANIAAKTGLRGMDALIVTAAQEYDTQLVSFDKELIEKSKYILKKK